MSIPGVNPHSNSNRAYAVTIAVLVVVVSLVAPLSLVDLNSDGDSVDTYTVTYHSGSYSVNPEFNESTSEKTVTIEYFGVPTAEYNPQLWKVEGSDSSITENWNQIKKYGTVEEKGDWFWTYYVLNSEPDEVSVFTGWSINGDWETQGFDPIDPGEDLRQYFGENRTLDLYATWDRANEIEGVGGDSDDFDVLDNIHFETGTKYTNLVIVFENNLSMSNILGHDHKIGKEGSAGFTIRSITGEENERWLDVSHHGYSSILQTDVIIDSIGLWTDIEPDESEDNKQDALYANGHQLIIGTNVHTNSPEGTTTIYGGSIDGNVEKTDVRIFSGDYQSIYGGCSVGNVTGWTSVTILGTTEISNTLYGGSDSGNVGSTGILFVSGTMDNPGKASAGYPIGDSHSNIVAGSRTSGTVSESNVTISNKANIFAVQGGGRLADTRTDETNVTISGYASVQYMVCGSVTDGNTSENHIPVGTSNVLIKDSPTIGSPEGVSEYSGYGYGSVFGGGWDTYKNALNSSTERTNVTIFGGIIHGSVYGGGFRGSIGNGSEVEDAVNVTISGGIIHGSVYGGGKGGKDPMAAQLPDDDKATGRDSDTGRAYVYGDIRVTVSNGTVKGSVYGGGEGAIGSKPGDVNNAATVFGSISIRIESSTIDGNVYGGGFGRESAPSIAHVTGSTSVHISNVKEGAIDGDIFGGGKFGMIEGNSTVSIDSDAFVDGIVFGGGDGSKSNSQSAEVFGVTSVLISGKVGDVYGGGNLASVGGTSITLTSAVVFGSVYGGGYGNGGTKDSATVAGSVSIEMMNSSIGGNLVGGGFGMSMGTYSPQDYRSTLAAVYGSITMDVAGTSSIGGDVYGAGMYGTVGHAMDESVQAITDSIYISLTGADITVEGSVYGGGYGELGRPAIYVSDRTIIINGASIGGSVYGGSRLGNDNHILDEYGSQTLISGTSHIYFVSGDIKHGSSGNIYGAGYRGISNIDSNIFIGTEATEETSLRPLSGTLDVHSIYGGSSIGDSVVDGAPQVLMSGSSYIYIGGTASDYPESLTIDGDVFGGGDYCEIGGDAYITFENFVQEGTMLSVQKATEVRIVSSSLTLLGDLDGTSTEGSPRLALNRIGMLRLESTKEHGQSHLVMSAATSQISGYVSSYDDEPSISDGSAAYNSITMQRGMIFSILGTDNNCEDMGEISGITHFSNEGDYYGAFVIAGKENMDVDSTGFVVVTDNELRTADYNDFRYTFADHNADVRAWFIKGAYSVEGTAIIEDSVNPGNTITVGIPKIRNSSEIAIVGYYFNADTPDSLSVVDELTGGIPGSSMKLTVGKGASGSDRITFGDGNGLNLASNEVWPITADEGSKGISLDITLETLQGFSTTGYIGSITIHMAEMSGDAVTDVFDVVVGVYLKKDTSSSPVTITRDVIMDLSRSGSTEVYLPALSGNRTGTYTVTSFPSGEYEMSIMTVPSNISKNGWLDSRWDTTAMTPDSSSKVLGNGAVYSPVISIDLKMDGYQDGQTLELKIEVADESTGETELTIVVKLVLRGIPTLQVEFLDTYLNVVGGSISDRPWVAHQVVFTLEVDYKSVLSSLYVAVNEDYVKDGIPFWSATTQEAFYEVVSGSLYKKNVDGIGLVQTYTSELAVPVDQGYVAISLEVLLDAYIDCKPDTIYGANGDITFTYSENSPNWYDNAGGYSEFNFDSLVTNDVPIYSGYTVIVTIHVLVEGDDGTFELSEDFYIDPSEFLMGAPNSEIDLNDVDLILSEGYEVIGWYSDEGMNSPIKDTDDDENTLIYSTYTSASLYVAVGKSDYTVTIKVDGLGEEDSYTINSVTAGGAILTLVNGAYGYYNYDSGQIRIVADFGKTYHISSIDGTIDTGGHVNAAFVRQTDDGSVVDGGWVITLDAVAGNIELVIELSDEYTVTFRLPDGADNGRFHISEIKVGDGGDLSVIVVEGDGPRVDIVEVNGGFKVTVDAPSLDWGYKNGVVVSIYSIGQKDVYKESVGLTIDSVDSNIVVDIYVSIEWEVRYPKSPGFTISYDYKEPAGGSHAGSAIHTGDILTLTCNDGYRFDSSFSAHGVSVTSGDSQRTYTVVGFYDLGNGYMGVLLGSATKQVLEVTISVHFGILGWGSDYPVSAPGWTLTIDGSVSPMSPVSYDSRTGLGIYTIRLNPGVYNFLATFADGYKEASITNVLVSEGNHEFDLYAIPNVVGEGGYQDFGTTTIHAPQGGVGDDAYTVSGEINLEEEVEVGGSTVRVTVISTENGYSTLRIEGIPDGLVGTVHIQTSGLEIVLVIVPKTQGSGSAGLVPS